MGFAVSRTDYTGIGYENIQEYLIFSVDETREMPIQIDTAINHQDLAELYTKDEAPKEDYDYDFYYYTQAYMERAVYVNDTLYVISSVGITSHDLLNDYTLLETVIYQD